KIKKVTYAPELDDNFEFTKYLCENNIIPSAGHSSATFEDIEKAVSYGLSSITHFHNGQSPHHHRTPGVVTAGFTFDELKTEVIVDGVHLHPDTVKSVVKIKGINNVTLITDSMEAKGLEDGDYELGGQKVIKVKNEVRLESGSLAGSVNTMIDSIKNVMSFAKCSLEDAVTMASTNPAKELGLLTTKGSLDIGKDADIVILNNDYNVVKTICRGKVAFEK
ncbi:MAG: N-acetylglucosamine-6-phosphate deacetylase, partial [Peptostreptococcaceae bacterium]